MRHFADIKSFCLLSFGFVVTETHPSSTPELPSESWLVTSSRTVEAHSCFTEEMMLYVQNGRFKVRVVAARFVNH